MKGDMSQGITDIPGAAKLLSVSPNTIRRLLKQHKLRGFRHSNTGKIYLLIAEIYLYLDSLLPKQEPNA